ncbi:hypothetical protein RTBOTA2_006163 [Rhodotorula toruloides]|nr:hypothetical protein RTBOTA2_006163 [Rhodotorula toruloides]
MSRGGRPHADRALSPSSSSILPKSKLCMMKPLRNGRFPRPRRLARYRTACSRVVLGHGGRRTEGVDALRRSPQPITLFTPNERRACLNPSSFTAAEGFLSGSSGRVRSCSWMAMHLCTS